MNWPLNIKTIFFLLLTSVGNHIWCASVDESALLILKNHCYECHSSTKAKGGLKLDRRSGLLNGGDSGEPAVIPGDSSKSHLLQLVSRNAPDKQMPPEGDGLTQNEIHILKEWIDAGARTPEGFGPDKEEVPLSHWSFQPLLSSQTGGTLAGVDHFILAGLEKQGLNLSPQASSTTRIRRLNMILHGLPAPMETIQHFQETDLSQESWERLVDEALASPHYGEAMAGLWLDIARFGETQGFETNRERPNAWPYRDWVIDAFNSDMPYDHFIRAQVAGDALNEAVGTSFLVAGPNDIVKGQDPKLGPMQRMNELDDMINTTGTAFVGLTLGCARCHNHKFDPISQKDYYAVQAVFAGVEHGDTTIQPSDPTKTTIRALDQQIAHLYQSILSKIGQPPKEALNAHFNEEKFAPIKAKYVRFYIEKTRGESEGCIDELEIFSQERNVALKTNGAIATSSGDFQHPLHKLSQINDGHYGNSRSWISAQPGKGWVQIEFPNIEEIDRITWSRDRERQFTDRVISQYRIETGIHAEDLNLLTDSSDRSTDENDASVYLESGIQALTGNWKEVAQQELEQWRQLRSRVEKLKKAAMVYAGQFNQPGPTYRLYRGEPDAPREEVDPDTIQVLGRLGLHRSTPERDRRLAFAKWLSSPQNPLTARVFVNRLWQFHFGRGLVSTPNDFGYNGMPPTHPELLDWLAHEFIRGGWSVKHIHRIILTSRTWNQESRPHESGLSRDAGNQFLWRYPQRRLPAEGIRDSILSISGALNLRRGGPGFSGFEVELENVRHYHPRTTFGPEEWRRMIYMTKVRQEKDAVFGAFDCPDSSQIIPVRSRSTTPIQALNLMNSPFVTQQVDIFARRLRSEAGETTAHQIRQGWLLAFGRDPEATETEEAEKFILNYGLESWCRALINSNEFVFIP